MEIATPKTEDRRNVTDYYKYWTNEAIKADLDKNRHPFTVLCCNIVGDYNVSTVVRCSNAFLAQKTYIYGNRKWDRRGAVGVQNYETIEHIPENSDFSELKKYTWVGIDNVGDATPIEDFVWPENPLLCFGEEGVGLQKVVLDQCAHRIYIKQYGSVRSLNVGVAAGIAMQDFVTKYVKGKR